MKVIRTAQPPTVPDLVTGLRTEGRVMIRTLRQPCHTRCAVMQVLRTAVAAIALDTLTNESIGDTHQ